MTACCAIVIISWKVSLKAMDSSSISPSIWSVWPILPFLFCGLTKNNLWDCRGHRWRFVYLFQIWIYSGTLLIFENMFVDLSSYGSWVLHDLEGQIIWNGGCRHEDSRKDVGVEIIDYWSLLDQVNWVARRLRFCWVGCDFSHLGIIRWRFSMIQRHW